MTTITGSRTLPLSILLGLLGTIGFLHATGGAAHRGGQDPNGFAALVAPASEPVRRQILDAAMTAFAPSLEMKENVGFLLTPALLVQEIISDDVIVTYHCE
jgi:hypothetical protein